MGSELTAASGGKREVNEWPRSAMDKPASTGEVHAGHRNRNDDLKVMDKKINQILDTAIF